MAFGQLSLIKRIYPPEYKKIYNYGTLVDIPADGHTLMNVVEAGRGIMNLVKG